MAKAARGGGGSVDIDGQQVRLTNLDKVLYPETGTTKGEVLLYYTEIADRMLPQLAGRPATRKRWPNGVGTERDPEIVFFTKNLDSGTPDWITRQGITHSDGVNLYPLIDSLASLTQMASTPRWSCTCRSGGSAPTGSRPRPTGWCSTSTPGRASGWPNAPRSRCGSGTCWKASG